MTTKHNDDWFNDLADAVKWLFDADKNKLEKIEKIPYEDRKWINFAIHSLEASKVRYDGLYAPVHALKAAARNDKQIQDLDFNDIKSKMCLLKGLLSEVASDQNGEKRLTFTLNLKTGRLNDAVAVVLIAYIQSVDGKQTDENFARNFIDLTKPLREATSQPTQSQPVNKTTTPPAGTFSQPQNMTLILFFGQSHKVMVNEIKDKKQLNESDYELLENKCEWFWYGRNEKKPAEIASDEQDNMCWLQLDMKLDNPPTVRNLLHLKDFIKKIKKQPKILIQIRSSGNNTFDLDNEDFIKA